MVEDMNQILKLISDKTDSAHEKIEKVECELDSKISKLKTKVSDGLVKAELVSLGKDKQIALIMQSLEQIVKDITSLKEDQETEFRTLNTEFKALNKKLDEQMKITSDYPTVRNAVFGLITVIVLGFIGALISLVMISRGQL